MNWSPTGNLQQTTLPARQSHTANRPENKSTKTRTSLETCVYEKERQKIILIINKGRYDQGEPGLENALNKAPSLGTYTYTTFIELISRELARAIARLAILSCIAPAARRTRGFFTIRANAFFETPLSHTHIYTRPPGKTHCREKGLVIMPRAPGLIYIYISVSFLFLRRARL